MYTVPVEIKFIDHGLQASYGAPLYATEGSAAVDLRACMDTPFLMEKGASHVFHAGFAMHIKSTRFDGVAAMIIPRSGLGIKNRLTLLNGTGLIDSDYQGEVMIGLINEGAPYTIKPYQRIAQMLFVPVFVAEWTTVLEFSQDTTRGTGGFGSTGEK